MGENIRPPARFANRRALLEPELAGWRIFYAEKVNGAEERSTATSWRNGI